MGAVTLPSDVVATYALYVSSWSRISDEERNDRLRRSVVPGLDFRNPHKNRVGVPDLVEQIHTFQANSPGASFRVNWVIGFGNEPGARSLR